MPSREELLGEIKRLESLAEVKALESQMQKAPTKSPVESAVRGAAQGVTMGFADELSGAANAAGKTFFGDKKLADIGDTYRQERNLSRSEFEKARADNPGYFTAGEVGGSVGSAFIPGLGIAKGTKLMGTLGKAAGLGALQSAGLSAADLTKGDVGKFSEDVAAGALTGAAVQGAFTGAGKVLSGLTPKNLAKKSANVLLGAPEEAMERYIKDPKAIQNADNVSDLAKKLQETVDVLQNRAVSGSKASREILKESGKKINSLEISKILQDKADEITASFEGVAGSAEKVKARDFLINEAKKYSENNIDLSASRIKDLVQDLQGRANYDVAPGQFNSFGSSVAKEMRRKIDSLLKEDKNYAEAMKLVAKDADLLSRLSPKVRDTDRAKNLIRNIGKGKKEDALNLMAEIDTQLGTDFVNAIQNSVAKESMKKGAMNGSRNVNLYKAIADMGQKTNIPLAGQAGALIGATVDKYGPEVAQKAVDLAVSIERLGQSQYLSGVKTAMSKILGFARRGDPAAVLTFQLLDQPRPDLIQSNQRTLQLPGSGQ